MPSFTRRELEPTIAAASSLLQEVAPNHCVIGGVAVMVHAARAYTADVDFLVDYAPGEKARLVRAAETRGWRVERKSDWQLRVHTDDTYLDLVDAQVELQKSATREAIAVDVGGWTVRVAPLVHLVALKVLAGRPRDRADVMVLADAHADLDIEAVRAWVEPFGVEWPLPNMP